jgi:adenylate cyclase
MKRERIPKWFLLGFCIAVGANTVASVTTYFTIGLMHGVSEFALRVRQHDLHALQYYRTVAYPSVTAIVIWYLWPILKHFRCEAASAAPLVVQQRVVSASLFLTLMGFAPWCLSALCFPLLTVVRFGYWSTDLMSQQVLSPLVNGFLAAASTYLLTDWIFRRMVIPHVFPSGRLTGVAGAVALRVRGRLLFFLVAVAFAPLFTMFGIIRAATVRIESGMPADAVLPGLAAGSSITFAIYVLLGIALTLVVAGTLTQPLAEMAAALRRVSAGDLNTRVRVDGADEVGALQDGVNALVATLRDNEHILQTFGRIVEPSVRDHLLSGEVRLGGEVRTASVLFCDLRGFTAMAERTPPAEMVATLNEFFTVLTTWVRTCGGFVDKFIGDALMVVFGLFDPPDAAPAPSAAAALRCALGVRDRLADLNAQRTAVGQPPLSVSVGLHTGEVLAGLIGAADRHEYTVIGDAVNVAQRLQQLAKEEGRDLLVSETTYELARTAGVTCTAAAPNHVSLRGRDAPLRALAVA